MTENLYEQHALKMTGELVVIWLVYIFISATVIKMAGPVGGSLFATIFAAMAAYITLRRLFQRVSLLIDEKGARRESEG